MAAECPTQIGFTAPFGMISCHLKQDWLRSAHGKDPVSHLVKPFSVKNQIVLGKWTTCGRDLMILPLVCEFFKI